MCKLGGRRLAGLFAAVALGGSLAACASVSDASLLPFQRYKIGATTYYSTDSVALARHVPGLPGSLSLVLGLLDRCRGLGVRAYLTSSFRAGGIVAYGPRSLLGCIEVANGGPGAFEPCVMHFWTAPAGAYYVVIAATDRQTCVDLSAEVPGGEPVATRTALANGFPAGSRMVVKCQRSTSQGLFDFLAPPANVPASRPAFWLDDYYVTPHGPSVGVPYC